MERLAEVLYWLVLLIAVLGIAGRLTSRPTVGLLRPLVSTGVGGVLLRRLVPVVLLLPNFLVGLLVFRTRFNAPRMLAVMAVGFTVVMMSGLRATARGLDRFHGNQRIALEQSDRATTPSPRWHRSSPTRPDPLFGRS